MKAQRASRLARRSDFVSSPDAGPLFGAWCELAEPLALEICARAGFDWVCIDLQHGYLSSHGIVAAVQAVENAGVRCLVRVPANEAWLIGKALDAGASGVIVPMVETPADAQAAASATRFAPAGTRSLAIPRGSVRNAEEWNEYVQCVVMIETEAALTHLDEICTTTGVDAIYVGPGDLGRALTASGRVLEEEVLPSISEAARGHEMPVGCHARDVDEALSLASMGFDFVGVLSDRELLERAAQDLVSALKSRGTPEMRRSDEQSLAS